MKRVLAVTAAAIAGVAAFVSRPADAVVHEIYAAWCAGRVDSSPRASQMTRSRTSANR